MFATLVEKSEMVFKKPEMVLEKPATLVEKLKITLPKAMKQFPGKSNNRSENNR